MKRQPAGKVCCPMPSLLLYRETLSIHTNGSLLYHLMSWFMYSVYSVCFKSQKQVIVHSIHLLIQNAS